MPEDVATAHDHRLALEELDGVLAS
ncbi:MAG: hypothetical protein JWO69_719, partial [Thermoleophilia bacterium]|nr:hypothetical protein [Thermoleophilia bacterium]